MRETRDIYLPLKSEYFVTVFHEFNGKAVQNR